MKNSVDKMFEEAKEETNNQVHKIFYGMKVYLIK